MSIERDLLREIWMMINDKDLIVVDFEITAELDELMEKIKKVFSNKEELQTLGISPEYLAASLEYIESQKTTKAQETDHLRNHFAGLAMQGIIDSLDIDFREVAADAYGYADAMLVERDKCKNGLSEGL